MEREEFDIFIFCLRVIQSTAGVLLNLLTLICMVKYKSLRNPAGVLVAILALSDTLHGFVIYALPLRNYYNAACIITFVAELLTINVQLLSFCMLGMERRNSLLAQLNATTKWTVKKVRLVMVVGLLLLTTWHVSNMGASLRSSPHYDNVICVGRRYFPAYYRGINISLFWLAVITVTTCYTSIAGIVLRSHRQVTAHQPITVKQRERRKADLLITKMMAMVVGAFFTLYIPVIISIVFMTESPPFWQHVVHQLAFIIYDVNFWINPVIYAWRNKQFRKAYRSLFSGCRLCRTTDNNPAVHINAVSPLVNS